MSGYVELARNKENIYIYIYTAYTDVLFLETPVDGISIRKH